MTILLSILVALLLLISIWVVRNRAADHSEYDVPVTPFMIDTDDVSAQHQAVLDKLKVFHEQTARDVESQRAQMDEFFSRNIDATLIATDVNGIPGEWVLATGADPDRRLLYLHGGGFRLGSPRSHRYLTSELARLAGVSVLALDYRMQPEYKTLDCHVDARSAYRWIMENGPDGQSPVQDMFIAGDSAGGTLTLTTIAWARNEGLPAVNGAIAMAPLTDSTMSSPSWRTNLETDPFLGPMMGQLFKLPKFLVALIMRASSGTALNNPEISPLLGDLSNLPETLIQVSRHELLFDDSQRYANKASSAGSKVSLQVWPIMVHVFQAFGPELPEANDALHHIGEFIRARFSKPMVIRKAG